VALVIPVASTVLLALANEKTAPAIGVSVGSVVDALMKYTGTVIEVDSPGEVGGEELVVLEGVSVTVSLQP
jgi:hypothetical protein